MTVERVEKFIRNDLDRLPEDHDDRAFLEAQLKVIQLFLEARGQSGEKTKTEPQFNLEQKEKETRPSYLRRAYQTISRELSTGMDIYSLEETVPFRGTATEYLDWYEENSYRFRSQREKYDDLAQKIISRQAENERRVIDLIDLTEKEKTPIKDLNLSTRAMNCVRRYAGFYRVTAPSTYLSTISNNIINHLPSAEEAGTLAMRTRDEIAGYRNAGVVTVLEIEQKLEKLGLTFATPSID